MILSRLIKTVQVRLISNLKQFRQNYSDTIKYNNPTAFHDILLPALILLILYRVFRWTYIKATVLPEEAYFEPLLIPQILKNPTIPIVILALNFLLFLNYKNLSWSKFSYSSAIRYFVFFVSLIVAWVYSTYDYNFYYGEAHYVARICLIILAILIWRHPIFISPFLLLAFILVKQFHYPLGNFSWTDKQVVFDVLVLFNATLYLKLFRNKVTPAYVLLVLCIQASNYFIPGLGKLKIGWHYEEELYYLVAASYANGWLRFIDEGTILQLIDLVKGLNQILVFFTLIVELGALLMFIHKRAPFWILIGATLLHLGIFVFSGIFFWKWILLNLALVLLIMALKQPDVIVLFSRPGFVVSIFVIIFSPTILGTRSLAWHDTPLTYTYELEAIGASGKNYNVPRYFMSPYDLVFAQNRFTYLSNEKMLVGLYGTTPHSNIARELKRISNVDQLNEIKSHFGTNYYDEARAETFDNMVRNFFGNSNRRNGNEIFMSKFSAPAHIWNFARANNYEMQEPIKEVRVRFLRVYFDENTFEIIESGIVRVIDDIPCWRQNKQCVES